MQEAKELHELFPLDKEISQSVVEEIGVGDRVLLVLDGFDEYPPANIFFTVTRLIEQIIAGECLPGASLVITSRPIARMRFRRLAPNISKHVEILGFTAEDRIEFARSAFSSVNYSTMLTQFLDYCSGNPTIMSMMYIPLNCAIITQVYIDHQGDSNFVPKTMTQLYTALSRSLIRRYMIQKGISHKCIPDNFKDLPSEVLGPFSQLASVAYKKLKLNELVFSLPDENGFDHMGFMNVSVEMYVDSGAHHSYNFLHLSIQEYLAAWHICQMGDKCDTIYDEEYDASSMSTDSEGFSRHYDDNHNDCEQLKNVLVFIYGFLGSKLKNNLTFYNSLSIIGGFHEWSYFDNLPDIDWRKDVLNNLIQYLFEAYSPHLCSEILSDAEQELQVEITSPVNCHMFSYCYVNSNTQWHVRFTSLELLQLLSRCLVDKDIQGCMRSIAVKHQCVEEHLMILQTLPKMENLSELYLNDCGLSPASCVALAETIYTYPNLKSLDISSNKIGSGGCVPLFSALSNLQKLESLNIVNNELGIEDAESFNHLIKTVSTICKLSVGDHLHFTDLRDFWLSCDFVAKVLPIILKASNVTCLTIATGECLLSVLHLKLFCCLSKNKSIKYLCIDQRIHPCHGSICARNNMAFVSNTLLMCDVSLVKKIECKRSKPIIFTEWLPPTCRRQLHYGYHFRLESPLTIEESITLLNSALCTSNVQQDVINFSGCITSKDLVRIERLGFSVRRGHVGPKMKFDKFLLLADFDSLQPVIPRTLYHSRSCPNLASLKAVAQMKYDPLERGLVEYFKYSDIASDMRLWFRQKVSD